MGVASWRWVLPILIIPEAPIIELVSLNEDEAKLTGKQYNENN